MSTDTIFLAGAKLAFYVLGKIGPMQVNYYNWRREPLETSFGPLGSPRNSSDDTTSTSHSDKESMDIEDEDNSMDSADTLETDSEEEVGGLGILLLGRTGELITFQDIEELIETLQDVDYFAHYPLVDVSYDESKRQITFDWST